MRFKAALCSPAFLYLEESDEAADEQALCCRRMRWRRGFPIFSGPPCPTSELAKAAATGELQKPAVLLAQTRRMLADPRSTAFVERIPG